MPVSRTHEGTAAVAPVGAPSTEEGGDELLVHVTSDPAAFDALEPEWNDLLERSDATVFQTFEWQRTWWRHFGEPRGDARLHLVTVRDRGTLVAVAPLWVESARALGMFTVRRLLFVGRGDSDYLDVIAARGSEEECTGRIAAQLAADAALFDVAVLEDTSDRSRTGPLLHEALVRHGWTTSREVADRCPEVPLRRSWEETVAGLKIHHRREIRRRLRNIEREHRVELEVVPAAEVEPAIREFIEMHQERWARDGYWGAFADPRVAAFHRDVAPRVGGRGWLFLAFLRVDGQRCAGNYGFSFRDAVATFQGGVRDVPELARLSPGRVLHARAMQYAIERGATRYDFMRGPELYKYDFDASDVPNWTLVAFPRSPSANRAWQAVLGMQAAVLRRALGEARALRVAARQGWFSRAMVNHIGRVGRRGTANVRRLLAAAWPAARSSST